MVVIHPSVHDRGKSKIPNYLRMINFTEYNRRMITAKTKAPYIFRVFTDEEGRFGYVASVVIDEGRHIPDAERQDITRKLNTGETAFINDVAHANVSIIHPQGEIGFAGVVALATAWLLSKLQGKSIQAMYTRDGKVKVWQDGELTWTRTSLSILPPWNYKQLENDKAVEDIKSEDTAELEHTMMWAWIDEDKGLIRARTFAADWEILEAQGNGSGSMMLAAQLKRGIEIRHGKGRSFLPSQRLVAM